MYNIIIINIHVSFYIYSANAGVDITHASMV